MFRRNGIILLLIVAVIWGLVWWLLSDQWLEERLEHAGMSLVRARVDIDNLDASLTELRIRWTRLQVTDPNATMTNILETDTCEVDIALVPLFSRKFIVESLLVGNLRLNTPRETDGALSEDELAELTEEPDMVAEWRREMQAEASQMPVFNPSQLTRSVNADSLLARLDLRSPGRIDSLRDAGQARLAAWDQRIDRLPNAATLDSFRTALNQIDPQKIDDLDRLKAALTTATTLGERVKSLRTQVNETGTALQSDLDAIRSARQNVPDWIQSDLQRALNMAKLPDLSVGNIARLLFGERILERAGELSGWIGRIRSYATRARELTSGNAPPDPPRLQGVDIPFGTVEALPGFWIRKLDLSGVTPGGLRIRGTAADIVSEQRVIGRPTTLTVTGSDGERTALTLEAAFNYLDNTARESVGFAIRHMALDGVQLSDFPLLPSKIESGRGDIEGTLVFEDGDFEITTAFTSRTLDFADAAGGDLSPRMERVRTALRDAISQVKLKAEITRQEGQMGFRVNSNLDKLIADELKAIASGELQAARQKLETAVRERVEPAREKLESTVAAREAEIRERIDTARTRLDTLENDIEARKAELQKRIENFAKDKLKNLFNRP